MPNNSSSRLMRQTSAASNDGGMVPNVFRYLTSQERLRFALLVVARILVTILDLLGMAFVGLSVSVVAGTTVSNESFSGVVLAHLERFAGNNFYALIAGLAIGFFTLKGFLSILLNRVQSQVFGTISTDKATTAFRRLLSVDLKTYSKWKTSDVIYGLSESLEHSFSRTLSAVTNALGDFALLVAIVVVLALKDFVLFLFVAGYFAAIALTLYLLLGVRTRWLGKVAEKSRISLTQTVTDAWSNYRQVRVMPNPEFLTAKFGRARAEHATSSAKLFVLGGLPRYILEIAVMLGIGIIAVQRVMNAGGELAPDTLALFLAGSFRIASALLPLQGAFDIISQNRAAGRLGYELLDTLEAPTIKKEESPQTQDLGEKPEIRARKLGFRYPDEESDVLNGLDLNVKFGSCLAIVGPSGVGKSSLSDLLLGVLEPTSGSLKIGGVDASRVLADLRGVVAIVPQRVSTFEETFAVNISLSNSFDMARVREAARLAGLEQRIDSAPLGFHSILRDNEAPLSGGELQRLGLARALYQSPKVLILDEFTSALDHRTELQLIETIRNLKSTCTVVLITHRTGPLVLADHILDLGKNKSQKVNARRS